jgi:hypothetical protein
MECSVRPYGLRDQSRQLCSGYGFILAQACEGATSQPHLKEQSRKLNPCILIDKVYVVPHFDCHRLKSESLHWHSQFCRLIGPLHHKVKVLRVLG